jgi:SAM-dependent methyltransferase
MGRSSNLCFDPHTPKPARMYDYWRGGHNNYDADRRKADQIEGWYPAIRRILADNAAFTSRAITWAARRGIRYYIDLGSGIPAADSIHAAAREIVPDAHVVYVDHDREVIDEARLTLDKAHSKGVGFVRADLRDTDAVLAAPALQELIPAGEPTCVILANVLHFVSSEESRETVSKYARRLVPGSLVVISAPHNDDPVSFAGVHAAWTSRNLYNHSREEIAGFFGDLEMVPPGLVVARGWRGGMKDAVVSPRRQLYVLGGVGLQESRGAPQDT